MAKNALQAHASPTNSTHRFCLEERSACVTQLGTSDLPTGSGTLEPGVRKAAYPGHIDTSFRFLLRKIGF